MKLTWLVMLLLWSPLPGIREKAGPIVPKGTEIFAKLGRSIEADKARQGDLFFATVSVPVFAEGRIAIPPGSFIKGRVERLNVSKEGRRTGIRLRCDTLILPEGKTVVIEAAMSSAEDPAPPQGTEESAPELETGIASNVRKGVEALISLKGGPDQLAKDSEIIITLQADLRLKPTDRD